MKEKETIIQILRNHSLIPIFGKNGSLVRTYSINKRDNTKRKELIHKGDILCLPIRIHFPKKTESQEQEKKIPNIIEKNLTNKEDPLKNKQIDGNHNSDCYAYIVKTGDTIIQILKKHALRPIFGKKGSLAKTLKINKREGKMGHIIHKGNTLCLPILVKNNTIIFNQDTEVNSNSNEISNIPIPVEIKEIPIKNTPIPIEDDRIKNDLQDKKHSTEDKIIEKDKSPPINEEKNKPEKQKNSVNKIENKNDSIPIKEFSVKKKSENKREEKEIFINNKKQKENTNEIYKSNINKKGEIIENKKVKCNEYTTEKNKYLIQILRIKNLYPIYGSEGSYQKTLDLNKNLNIDNHFFKEKTKICLPIIVTQNEDNNTQSEVYKNKTNNINYENNPHLFYTELGIKYLRLDEYDTTNGTSAEILSKAILSGEIGFIQKWDPRFLTYFGINHSISQIIQSDSNVVIGDSIIRLTNMLIGAKYNFYPTLYGNFEFAYGDELLFRTVDDNTIQMEKMSTGKMKFLGGYTFLEYQALAFHGEFAYLLNSPFSNEVYNSRIGQGFEGALIQTFDGKGWEFRTKLYYSRHYTYVPPIKFDYTEIGLLFRFSGELP